jgi:hypothetical protein
MLVVRRTVSLGGTLRDKIISEVGNISYCQIDAGNIRRTAETAPTRLTDFPRYYERLL